MRVHDLFGPAATGHTLDAFHGTGADIHAFRLSQSRNGAGSRESPLGLWFTDNPEAASQFADFAAKGKGANVIPVKLRLQNPWEVLHYDEIRDLVDRFTTFKRPGYELRGRQIRMVDDKVDYDGARNWLRSQGHDGIILRGTLTDSPDGKTPINQYVVLEPSQARSRFAKFDPEKRDSDGLLESRAFKTLDEIVTWADGLGVGVSVHADGDGIELAEINRDKDAKGNGAKVIHALCAYADRHNLPIHGTVTGSNDQLERYYSQFGFEVQEDERDDETGDVLILRKPSRDVDLWESAPDSPAFKAWFAGSKVVDENGRPMRVFHGTSREFTDFHPDSHFGTHIAANDRLSSLRTIFVRRETGQHVIPVYLRITNPLRVEDNEASDEAALLNAIARGAYPKLDLATARREGAYAAARKAGYDGLVYRNGMEDKGKLSWVIFDPAQAKSAISNTGRYDPSNPSIMENAPRRLGPSITDAVRAEAEAQGFDTRQVWYHGTDRRFKAFRTRGNHGELGHGIYLTRSQRAANSWAGKGNHVLACFLKPKPIFDLTQRDDPAVKKDMHMRHTRMLQAMWGKNSGAYDEAIFADWYANIWRREPNDTLHKLGFMGAVDDTSQIEGQIVVFDPTDIFIAARMPGW